MKKEEEEQEKVRFRRRGNNLKRFNDFYLEAKASIRP